MIIKIKFRLTFAGGAYVTDENGNDIYKVKGKVLSISRKKTLCNMNDEKLYTVRNKFINMPFTKSALIKDDSGTVAKVKNVFVSASYTVQDYHDDIVVDGKIFDPKFTIYKNGAVMATGRHEFSLAGGFTIDVVDPNDSEFLIALMVALNNIQRNKAND